MHSPQTSKPPFTSKLLGESIIAKKEIIYKNPKVKIGNGKLGPVELIIYNNDLYALKKIPKKAIDKPKRI